jgi:hypothetical protein
MREARETLEEAMRLCARAERLREDASRVNLMLAIGDDGQTLELLNRRGSNGDLTVAIDRFCEAAWGLGQTTSCWAQMISVEASRRPARPAGLDARRGERAVERAATQ